MYIRCTVNLCIATMPSQKCPSMCTRSFDSRATVSNLYTRTYTIDSGPISTVITTPAPTVTTVVTPTSTCTTCSTNTTTTATTTTTTSHGKTLFSKTSLHLFIFYFMIHDVKHQSTYLWITVEDISNQISSELFHFFRRHVLVQVTFSFFMSQKLKWNLSETFSQQLTVNAPVWLLFSLEAPPQAFTMAAGVVFTTISIFLQNILLHWTRCWMIIRQMMEHYFCLSGTFEDLSPQFRSTFLLFYSK